MFINVLRARTIGTPPPRSYSVWTLTVTIVCARSMEGKRSSVWAKSGSRKVIYRKNIYTCTCLQQLLYYIKTLHKFCRMILHLILFLFLSFVQIIQNYGEAFVQTVQALKNCVIRSKIVIGNRKIKGGLILNISVGFLVGFVLVLLVRRLNVKLHRKLLF